MTTLLVLVMSTVMTAKPVEPFEGVLEFKIVLQGGDGSLTTQVSPVGVHSSGRVKYLNEVTETTVVVRAKDPDVAWSWQPAERRFSKMPLPPSPKRKLTAELKGETAVAGVPCAVVVVTGPDGVSEYCSAIGFVGDATREFLVTAAQRLAPDLEEALRSAKGYGLVVRLKQTSPDGKVMSGYELTKVTRKKVDRALFDVEKAR